MPIAASDIDFKHSGGASNSDGNASIGGAISSNDIGQTLHDLFDQVSSAEASAGDTEYRLIYIQNNHGSITAENVSIFIETNTANSESQIAIGLATQAKNTTVPAIADEDTAPAGVSFSEPASDGAGLNPVDLEAGDYIGLWVRRTIDAAASAVNNDSATLRVAVDTAA